MLNRREEVHNYLIDKHLIVEDERVTITPLNGGVSNQVWKMTGDHKNWVIKQSLGTLKTAEIWTSDVNRIIREFRAMQYISPFLSCGVVPPIVFEDSGNHLFIMESAGDDAVMWKDQLFVGKLETKTVKTVASVLKEMHNKSVLLDANAKQDLLDMSYVEELRIQPFYLHLLDQFPQIRDILLQLVDELTQRSDENCFVHGDFSPKNMLVDGKGDLTLLDFEVAHFGNPVMDTALLSSHLILKGMAFNKKPEFTQLIREFMNEYGPVGQRFPQHLGVFLLARIKGKSPAEYVTEQSLKDTICRLSFSLIKDGRGIETVEAIEFMMKEGC
ncbi:MAG: aminoglycoside phosphotransferase family protein [Bacilli bacterium]